MRLWQSCVAQLGARGIWGYAVWDRRSWLEMWIQDGAVTWDGRFFQYSAAGSMGGLPMYVATRALYRMNPPTIFVPVSIKESVERLFNVHREMDRSELKHKLIGMNVGDEFQIRKDLKVKAFRTYHVIPSLGYIIYSVKQKLKQEYATLSGNEIKELRFSGVEVTQTMTSPEIAFTGDTTSDFIVDPDNTDVLKARILVMEMLKKTEASGNLVHLIKNDALRTVRVGCPG
ncbi:Nuclear ribonuclease Z [Platanthera guangdongensis]|uniref:Nuclear ribonuclease Z n=1 Tax=Platanthera guangdongensis TaxID=2320717 RepID=A0ABR2M473_9ASPA